MGRGRLALRASIVALTQFALAGGAHAADGQAQKPGDKDQIVIYGSRDQQYDRPDPSIETELDQNDIAAYGLDTVGDLIDQVLPQVDNSSDGPVVLLNGRPANGLKDVSDLPTEVVSKIEVLRPQAATQYGQSPSRRVVNIVIKSDHRQVTTNLTSGLATAGRGFNAAGEFNLLRLQGGNRRSLAIKANIVDPLFESDRPVIDDPLDLPYDIVGNIVSSPLPGGEIDPALSAAAGRLVTVAGVPAGLASPSLGDFAATAGRANQGDVGAFRTLVSRQRSYTANANFTQRLSSKTALSLTGVGTWASSLGYYGLSPALLTLPSASPFSPFSQDVDIARYFGPPLGQRMHSANLSLAGTLNTDIGRWRLSVSSNFYHLITHNSSDRAISIGDLDAAVLAGMVDPFAPLPPGLLDSVPVDTARSLSNNGSAEALATGSVLRLPTGMVTASLRLGWRFDHSRSRTLSGSNVFTSLLDRDEEVAQGSLRFPLLGAPLVRGVGDLGGEFFAAARHVTAAGWLKDYGGGLTWRFGNVLELRAYSSREEVAPLPNALTDPIVTIENVRTYDFIRNETVLVTYITGGNPSLPVERRTTTTLSGTLRPLAATDLTFNMEYQKIVGRGVFAALPPVNADVQAAFGDRFVRDASGQLILVDARPVAFALSRREQIRWSGNFSKAIGAPRLSAPGTAGGPAKLGSGWRFNANFSYTLALINTRLARSGLAEIDMLDGGALGYGGGQPRHLLQATGGLLRDGVGLQISGSWKSASRINAGPVASPSDIVFAPRTTIGARLFANLGPLLPHIGLVKNMRLTLAVDNLFDSKQRVTDRSGATPNGYQPWLLDPLGRTVSISLRKVF